MFFSLDKILGLFEYLVLYFNDYANEFTGIYDVVSIEDLMPVVFFFALLVIVLFSFFVWWLLYKFVVFLFNFFVR